MSVTDAHAGDEIAGVRWIGAADAMALRRSAYQRIVGAAVRAASALGIPDRQRTEARRDELDEQKLF